MTDIPEDMIVTVQDIRDAGHCVAGTRQWFAANNLDFRDFLLNGMAATEFAKIDGLAEAVVQRKLNASG